jgi:multidrug efflux pump subunit AcrA (membrane-fusion protein)
VLAEIDNRQRLLRPGSFARVALVLSVEEDAVLVPTEAIVPSISGPYVFVVADGIARRVGVSVGERQGGLTHVLRGVEAGVQVVSQGQFKVQDGSPVLSAVPGGA